MIFDKKIGKMVDVHCHVLPEVDDGADSLEEALEMLRIASEEGITEVIVTPHVKPESKYATPRIINEKIRVLQRMADESGLRISLYPGNEILYFDEAIGLLDNHEIYTLNESKRVMVEFSPSITYQSMRNSLENVQALGLVPVLAHAERYACLLMDEDLYKTEELKDLGIEIQINLNSVDGFWGKEAKRYTRRILKARFVDYMGTDAHNTGRRSPVFKKCYKKLSSFLDKEYLEDIFYYNALKNIIINQGK